MQSKQIGYIKAALMAILVASTGAAQAAVKCGQVGPGAVAINNAGANDFGILNGPYACGDIDIFYGPFTTRFYQQQESQGTLVSVGTSVGYSAISTTTLGANHIGLDPGGTSSGDSEWADFGLIAGPIGSGPITATFVGHLDGVITLSTGNSDIRSANATYWLGIAGTGITYQIGTAVQVVNGGPAVARTSQNVRERISLEVTLPVNTVFGMVGALSGQVSNGGMIDFRNTGSLDKIFLPVGYEISTHNQPLMFDGTGYIYAGAVPEPTMSAMLFLGLAALALKSNRSRKCTNGEA